MGRTLGISRARKREEGVSFLHGQGERSSIFYVIKKAELARGEEKDAVTEKGGWMRRIIAITVQREGAREERVTGRCRARDRKNYKNYTMRPLHSSKSPGGATNRRMEREGTKLRVRRFERQKLGCCNSAFPVASETL